MHCTTSLEWYIGKFVINFLTALFIYEGFLKEQPIECICAAGARDLARQKSGTEPLRSRCTCKRWRKSIYPCGCKRKRIIEECAAKSSKILTPNATEKLQKPSCCCGH